jgi:hypothetical protein
MRRLVVILLLSSVCSGCAALGWFREKPPTLSEEARLIARADELARDGQPGAARDLYARVAGDPSRDTVHARALYKLARLQVDPRSGLRDYRAAQLAFRRLLTEYPTGEWEAEARAWDAVLAHLAARDAELTTREAEAARLRAEAAKLAADLQRLKRIDLHLERRR